MQRNLTIKENRTGKAKKKKAEDKSQESFIKVTFFIHVYIS